ncbi:MAG: shikimate kinase [Rhizobiales bacterium]|nr:shikimate kinase [Hyphomicrobiales bacterium]
MARRSLNKEIEFVRNRLGNHAIVLVGLMGAGKTTVGRRLAERLGIPFVDADHEIELAAGKRISEIFTDHGEAYFREGERKVIARLLDSGAQVMATGGGAFMNEETRRRIRERGVSVWLRADLALLMKRVSRRSDRPLLNSDDPAAVMGRLIEQRYPTYATADITVDSRDIPHTSIVKDVIKALADWTQWDRLDETC